MKKVIFCFCLSFLATFSYAQEVKFDENESVSNQIKKNIYDYITITIDHKYNYVISLQKKVIGDTIEFIVYANTSMAGFENAKVYYRAKYLDTYIFSDYKNSSFKDSCGFQVAAQYLDKEEYEYFLREKKVPPPFKLINIKEMKLVFVNNKLIKKDLYY